MKTLPDRPCEECGELFTPNSRGARFCRPYCRYKHRDRARDPEAERARSRRCREANREKLLAAAAKASWFGATALFVRGTDVVAKVSLLRVV
jgi:hypothetical protein